MSMPYALWVWFIYPDIYLQNKHFLKWNNIKFLEKMTKYLLEQIVRLYVVLLLCILNIDGDLNALTNSFNKLRLD